MQSAPSVKKVQIMMCRTNVWVQSCHK